MLVDYSVELGRDDPALELPWSSEDAALRYFDLKQHPELLRQIPEASAYPELSALLARINMPGFPLQTAKCDAWHSREILPEEEVFGAECKFVSYVDLLFTDQDARLSFEKHEELARTLCRLLKRAPDIAAAVEFTVRRCYYHQDRDVRPSRESGDVSQRSGTSAALNRPLPQESMESADRDLRPAIRSNDQQRSDREFRDNETPRKPGDTETPRAREGVGHPDSTEQRCGITHPGDLGDCQSGFYLTAYVTGFGNSSDEANKRWSITLTLVQHALVQVANS